MQPNVKRRHEIFSGGKPARLSAGSGQERSLSRCLAVIRKNARLIVFQIIVNTVNGMKNKYPGSRQMAVDYPVPINKKL